MHYFSEIRSPIGKLTLASDGASLIGLWIEGQKYFGNTLGNDAARNDGLAVFGISKQWLDDYFAGRAPSYFPPLAPIGSDFRQSVWKILREIPYGQTMTYGEIAEKIERDRGTVTSARAVGGAVGNNPISIIIPCHRVVGTNGGLTGYAGGVDRKIRLLRLENAEWGTASEAV